MSISPRLQDWLEMRGVAGSNDDEFAKVVPWTRTTFLLCSTLTGIGTALASTPLLWAMVPIAALGAIFRRHPFDQVYNYGIRRLTRTQLLPRNAAPTRFACGLASVWLVATALAFDGGVAWLGYSLGGVLTAVGFLVGITHFCIPSLTYHLLFGDRAIVYRAVFGRRDNADSA